MTQQTSKIVGQKDLYSLQKVHEEISQIKTDLIFVTRGKGGSCSDKFLCFPCKNLTTISVDIFGLLLFLFFYFIKFYVVAMGPS